MRSSATHLDYPTVYNKFIPVFFCSMSNSPLKMIFEITSQFALIKVMSRDRHIRYVFMWISPHIGGETAVPSV